MYRFIVLFLCLSASAASAQNIEYIGSTLWTGMNDVKVAGNYAYCAFPNGLVILDVSNPEAPAFVSRVFFEGSGAGLDVTGGYVYFADGLSGLKIVNVTSPTNPVVTGTYGTPGSAAKVFVAAQYAYVVVWAMGLQVVDISDPQHPRLVGS